MTLSDLETPDTAEPDGTVPADATPTATQSARRRWAGWTTGRRADLLVYLMFTLAAGYVMQRLWLDPQNLVLGHNPTDQNFAEWMYLDQANALTEGRNPFFSLGQNAPLGINLMGNVATHLVSWLLTPVTLLFGAGVTFAIAVTFNLAATASAWYYVLSRHLVRHRAAAILGAAFCGFAPGMISESNAHIHIPAQYLAPFIVLYGIRLREPDHRIRNGVILGLLISAQVYLGLEVLLLVALGCAVMVACYALMRWSQARAVSKTFFSSLAVAVAVVLVLCAYPLWVLFFGPRHYTGIVKVYSADLTTFFSYPTQSLGGLTAGKSHVPNLAEEAAFFGWPLVIAVIGLGLLMWRSLPARVVTIIGALFAVLALGPHIMWKGQDTGLYGPYILLSKLPIFDSLITLRLALITATAIGLLLAFTTDWVLDRAPAARSAGIPLRAIAAVAAAALLVPLIPRPLPAVERAFVPNFITSGQWSDYVREGRTLVPVDPGPFAELRWAVAGEARFAVPRGFTLVPKDPPHDMTGVFNVALLPVEEYLWFIWNNRDIELTADKTRQSLADLRYLNADAVVLNATVPGAPAMADKISVLLGLPATRVNDVFLWQVADL